MSGYLEYWKHACQRLFYDKITVAGLLHYSQLKFSLLWEKKWEVGTSTTKEYIRAPLILICFYFKGRWVGFVFFLPRAWVSPSTPRYCSPWPRRIRERFVWDAGFEPLQPCLYLIKSRIFFARPHLWRHFYTWPPTSLTIKLDWPDRQVYFYCS